MSNTDSVQFQSPEHFNEITQEILPDAWSEVKKSLSFFTNFIKANGPDTFAPTVVVFNGSKNIVGVFTVRPFDGKEDLYQALSELLYLPVAIKSSLYIVVTDTNVRDLKTGDKISDALNISFVSPDFCYLYTLPYSVDSDNEVDYDYEQSHLLQVIKEENSDTLNTSGDMVELFFIFSHVDNTGPFTVDELLSYYDQNDFPYEIINKNNLLSSPSRTIFKE